MPDNAAFNLPLAPLSSTGGILFLVLAAIAADAIPEVPGKIIRPGTTVWKPPVIAESFIAKTVLEWEMQASVRPNLIPLTLARHGHKVSLAFTDSQYMLYAPMEPLNKSSSEKSYALQ